MTIRIFFSYSHKDKGHLDRLMKHLAHLLREKDIDPWYDGHIDPGQAITPEIRKALRGTDIFVALASPDYLASDYCYRKEYRPMLRKSKRGRPKVVVALVGTCDWPATEIAASKMLPDDAKSVDKHGNRNQAYLEIVRGIRRVVRSVRQEKGKEHAEVERSAAEKAKATAARKPKRRTAAPKPKHKDATANATALKAKRKSIAHRTKPAVPAAEPGKRGAQSVKRAKSIRTVTMRRVRKPVPGSGI